MKSVVVVGGGAVGFFSALTLAKRGARVTLLEAEREDFGGHGPAASLAAAGMLAPVAEAMRGGPPLLGALMMRSLELWREQRAGSLWADGVRFDGGALIADTADGARAALDQARALGAHAEPLAPSHWRKRIGLQTQAVNALWIEDEGALDPSRVLSGLAMDARRHGVQVMFGRDVEAIGANRVRTWEGEVFEGDEIILAPGAWAREAWTVPAFKLLRPAKGHLVPVRIGGRLGANVHAPAFYLARRGPDDVVLGSTMQFDDTSRHAEPSQVQGLLGAAEAALPGLVRARADQPAWAGVRPMSPDWGPIIGRSGDALVACGHSRNGWLLSPITAEILSALTFNDPLEPLFAAFSPARFEQQT